MQYVLGYFLMGVAMAELGLLAFAYFGILEKFRTKHYLIGVLLWPVVLILTVLIMLTQRSKS